MIVKRTFCSALSLVWMIVLSGASPLPHQALPPSRGMESPGPGNGAVLYQSSSTNTCSFVIQLASTGHATYVVCQQTTGEGVVPTTITQTFFRDLAMAQPLNRLPTEPACVKPVSFAVVIYILYNGQVSPDLSCAKNNVGRRLTSDVHIIHESLLKVRGALVRARHTLSMMSRQEQQAARQ